MLNVSMCMAPTRNSFSPPSSSRLSCNCCSSCHLHKYAILTRKELQVFFCVSVCEKTHYLLCMQVSTCASFHRNIALRTLVCANVHENTSNQHWMFSFIFTFYMMVCLWVFALFQIIFHLMIMRDV